MHIKAGNLCLLWSDTMHCKAALCVIDQPEVLTSSVNSNHIYDNKNAIVKFTYSDYRQLDRNASYLRRQMLTVKHFTEHYTRRALQ